MLEGHNYEVLIQKEGKRGVIRHSEIVSRRLVLFKDNTSGHLPGRYWSILANDLDRLLHSAFLEGHVIVQRLSFEEECQRSEKEWLVLSPVNHLQVLLKKRLHNSRFVHIESHSALSNGLIGYVYFKLGDRVWRQLANHMRLVLQAARFQARLIVQRIAPEEQAKAADVFLLESTLVKRLLLKPPDGEHSQVLLQHGAHSVCVLYRESNNTISRTVIGNPNGNGVLLGRR